MTRNSRLRIIGAGVLALVSWLVGSCGDTPPDVLIPNKPPTLAISASPIRDSVNVFIVTFNWNASDEDGQVARFLFAIDDTTSPGAWTETTSYELTLLVAATDSAGVDSIRVGIGGFFFERYRFRDAHSFYLRAIDDDGASSVLASISFTAETFAPETQILIPNPGTNVDLGSTFTVSWRGTDIDGTEDPVGYSWRIVQVESVILMTPAEIESTLYDPRSPGDPWTPFTPSTSAQIRDLQVPQDYIFGVIAIDQAGAIEPRLRTAEVFGADKANVLRIRASETGGQPRLCVSSSIKTTCFPGVADETRTTFQIPANSNITFTWEGDASLYGGRVTGYSYGIDLETDLPDDPGWRPESATLTRAVLRFDLAPGSPGEDHFLSVRVRDDVGSTTIARILLVVIPLSRERDVLLVDDFGVDRFGNVPLDCIPPPDCAECVVPTAHFPQDQCHDQYLREVIQRNLAAIGHPDWVVDRYEPLEPLTGVVIGRPAEIDSVSQDYWVYTGRVDLENLARYKLVIWNVRSEDNSQLRLMNREGEDNFLAVFIEAGGHVWISGTGCFSRTLEQPVGLGIFGFRPGEFIYRFLKIESEFEGVDCLNGCFRVSGDSFGNQQTHGFEAAYASEVALAEGYPESLLVGRPPFLGPTQGVPNGEAMVPPYGLDINPRLRLFDARLDTLYFYLSNGAVHLNRTSYMDRGATALRFRGPGQGKFMVWGFPLYFLPNQIDGLMSATLRWFDTE